MEALAQQMEEAAMQKEPELVPANEAPAPAAEPSAEQPPAPSPAKKSQQQGDLLDEVADKSIPKTINMSFEEDRANQVVSPGESTFDGTSTIGSSTSEPTTETNNSRTSRNRSSRKTPSSNRNSATNGGTGSRAGSRAGSRGGNSRGSNRKAASSNNQPSPATNSGRRTYHRNTYSGSSRMQSSTVPRPFKRPGPLSYSKTVRLGGSSAPFSAREVDDKTRAVLADMNEYDSAQLETENIAADIFSPGTGISDDEIRKIMRVRVSSKQMELEQQVAAGNKVIKRLKDTLTALTKGKNEYIHRSIDAEKNSRNGWAQALETAQLLDEDRGFFKQKVKQLEVDNTIWKDNAKDTMRELSLSEDKMQNLRNEIEDLKQRLSDAENAGTQALIALEVEKARNKESLKQNQEWRDTQLAKAHDAAERNQHRENVEAMEKRIREETDTLQKKLQGQIDRVRELENELVLSESQFARAIADSEAASSRANSKDKDMTELMKSIKDIQDAAHLREEEANKHRRSAEKKVSELEKALAVTKGELNVFNHERSTLKETLDSARQERLSAMKSLDDIKEQVDELKAELNTAVSQLTLEKELRSRSEQKEREERNERIALSAQMVAMTKEHAMMETTLSESKDVMETKWRKKLEAQEEKYENKEKDIVVLNERVAGLQGEISALMDALKDEKNLAAAENAEEMSKLRSEIEIMKERFRAEELKGLALGASSAEQVLEFEKTIREGQSERRKMHNLIQELRGNVRVFARIRPFLPGDGVDDDAQPMAVAKSETALKLSMDEKDRKGHSFTFDRVFGPSVGQEVVFTEVSEFVQSALDGYNVCLFSYGQTGSGKTHTMQGTGNGQMKGIIPRAIAQVGQYKELLEKDGWQYDMQVSFVEIYNESIRDLLRLEEDSGLVHNIKVGSDGRRFITDINMVPLEPSDEEAVEQVMRQAAKYRSVGSTDMNAESSRSHSVFTLHLTALNPESRQALRGTLNLCDLAGSERLDRSKATGARAKETVAINKSLSSLTDVFVSIGKKASHIPFRNSKLTYLLQPSLSGDGKTLMLVNMSPTEQSCSETLCSLRFASQVNKCELGKAKRSLEEVDEEDAASISSSMSATSSRAPMGGKRGGAMKSPPARNRRPTGGRPAGRR
uniref:Kinesin motor domain-containing protein n=1 Tax=Chaetoceros debilis TaxID=122233 RepID=A0A7S3Q460_9STRA